MKFQQENSGCIWAKPLPASLNPGPAGQTPLGTAAARMWSSLSPQLLSSWRKQNVSTSHPACSNLFLRLSPAWVWSRRGALFVACLLPTQERVSALGTVAENTRAQTDIALPHEMVVLHPKRQVRGPGCVPASVQYSSSMGRVSFRGRLQVIVPPAPEP